MTHPKITMRWDGEEGVISTADRERLLKLAATKDGWVTAADFAKDCMHETALIYQEVLAASPFKRTPA